MSTFYKSQEMFTNGDLRFNSLNGLNEIGEAESKITIKGKLDDLTINTLYRNYEHIARNLKVYPTVTIVSRNHQIYGGMGGLYYSEENHIEIIEHDRLVSNLAHEMRHAFQYIYFPDIYYATTYNNVRGYLDCYIERDARTYSYDFCVARQYWIEADLVSEDEEQYELIIQKRLSPRSIGLNDKYFRKNPAKGFTVSRDYHWEHYYNQDYKQIEKVYREEKSLWGKLVGCFQMALGCVVIIFISIIILGLLLSLF